MSGRFPEIAIAFETPPVLPDVWPAHWLGREASGNTLRLTDTQYEAEQAAAEIRRMFPDAQSIEANGMTPRSIFLVLAKNSGA